MALKVYIDGKFFDKDQAKISVFDHGLLYGDGVFEGIRVYNGRIFELPAHIKRLYESAKVIRLEISMSKEELAAWVKEQQESKIELPSLPFVNYPTLPRPSARARTPAPS